MTKEANLKEAKQNLKLQRDFIQKRDSDYEQHRVEICQKTRDLYEHFIVSFCFKFELF